MLFYIYRNAMTGKSNGSFLSESRRVVRGGRNPGRVSPLSRPLNGEVGGHGFSPLPETAFPPFWRETGRRAASAAKVGGTTKAGFRLYTGAEALFFYRNGGSPCSRSTKCTMRRSSSRTSSVLPISSTHPTSATTAVYLKTENLQVTGSFKVRGAYYKISQLSDEEKAHGVIACSAGNHAQGVALAATKNGIKSVICLPDGAPISRWRRRKNTEPGSSWSGGVYDDAYQRALELRDEKHYTFIHPFDDENVIAGRGRSASSCSNSFPRSTPWWCRSAAAD